MAASEEEWKGAVQAKAAGAMAEAAGAMAEAAGAMAEAATVRWEAMVEEAQVALPAATLAMGRLAAAEWAAAWTAEHAPPQQSRAHAI